MDFALIFQRKFFNHLILSHQVRKHKYLKFEVKNIKYFEILNLQHKLNLNLLKKIFLKKQDFSIKYS